MKYLITGGAGFIGSATAKALMNRGDQVVLIDNFNDYYDQNLKRDRIKIFLKGYEDNFKLYEGDIRDSEFLEKVFSEEKPNKVLHLAAMAGVRASLENPMLYADVNVMGTMNLLEMARKHDVENFVYASSSSVYGNNKKTPFEETDRVDHPVSPYAATKKATELLAHTYSHLYGLNTCGLRYFTVYGPWGRPDMGVFKFPERIIKKDEVIDVYNNGDMQRNFTYIDDIVSGTITVLDANLKYDVMNIGGSKTVKLMDFIKAVENCIGKEAKKNMMPMQPGDVQSTEADISKLKNLGWEPKTGVDEGIGNFVEWYKSYYNLS